MKFIIKDIDKIEDVDFLDVGSKAYNLLLLKSYKINIPNFFVITSSAFVDFLKFNNIDILAEKKEKIKSLIESGSFPEKLMQEIYINFIDYQFKSVAIRSSACAEDSKKKSFAGQFETYLAVGQSSLLSCIKKCWGSMFNNKIIAYMPDLSNSFMAIIVQSMVGAEYSGVVFTVNPINGNKDEMIVEVIAGIGKLLVDGEVNPTTYIVNKNNLLSNKYIRGRQEKKLIMDERGELSIYKENIAELSIDIKTINLLTKLCYEVEIINNYPMDIEWALKQDIVYILQARPITTINQFIK